MTSLKNWVEDKRLHPVGTVMENGGTVGSFQALPKPPNIIGHKKTNWRKVKIVEERRFDA